MTESKYKFTIETSNNGILNIPLIEGNALFVLGANGAGKSTLMQTLFNQNIAHTKRILAHRQTWFVSNSMNITASQKVEQGQYIKNLDSQANSRWQDQAAASRSGISIFDLINSENVRARNISKAVDVENIELAKTLARIQAPIQGINELLAISNIPIVISLEKDELLFASKNGSEPYSIAELSDGERNSLLICADVLTAEPHQLIILDEPERHLHRSIISPLLSSLFQKRKDCVFVISTHDIYLPIDHDQASILLLRSCTWNNAIIQNWDADYLSESQEISNDIKKEILGAKRTILFVEGTSGSLDQQIYQLIYPDVTVVSQGSCTRVEKAVEGIRETVELHWINAFGLIDADDRTEAQIQSLSTRGIMALKSYSVESLYYRLEVIQKIANRYSQIIGADGHELYSQSISNVIADIEANKKRLCSRLCEKKVRNQIMGQLPKHQSIAEGGAFEVNFDLSEILSSEEAIFDNLIAENNLNGLIERYPIRETNVISGIVNGIGLTRAKYECAVRKLIIDDLETRDFFRAYLANLSSALL